MVSANEYRDYADECVAWAKKAATDAERDTFLQMAQNWLRAATILDTNLDTKSGGSPASVHAPSAPTP